MLNGRVVLISKKIDYCYLQKYTLLAYLHSQWFDQRDLYWNRAKFIRITIKRIQKALIFCNIMYHDY